jgi:antirestriction protein ArdC
MSQTPEKKNRFQVSREVQEEFVNGIAETMLSLAETVGKGEKIGTTAAPLGMPFCPTTGREYGGANMARLMLTSMEKGYQDDRWLTFKQLQQYQTEHPDLRMSIKKGEHGVKLLRPEEIFFTVDEDGEWNFHTQDEAREIEAQRKQGVNLPPTQHKTLFYPFTAFNVEQVAGFPPKEQPAPAMTEVERNEFVERFIASSGIAVQHHNGPASYSPAEDQVKMPFPENFARPDDYYAAKLREFYSATGHSSRENRQREQPQTLKGQAFEEMRAEMFSMLAGAKLNLPMPENSASNQIAHWNQKFSGGDVKEVFQATAEAARMLTTMHQFEAGERPTAWWFPKSEAWPELVNMQMDRDAAVAVSPFATARAGSQPSGPGPRSAPPTLAESAAAFQATDDPVAKARLILQNPEFLEMALGKDPNAARELASLCDTLSQSLHMELDEKSRQVAAPVSPAPEQQTASAPRMRM